ncbi:uncharacterized protein BJX67DRAFT_691 [Aspergillus lucknowensis]|uniref:Uncharacterized protein n=1 Tax=Aspergillus lucknowensis TaxID=176173 RepID=A0ABR4M6Q5_9EURO
MKNMWSKSWVQRRAPDFVSEYATHKEARGDLILDPFYGYIFTCGVKSYDKFSFIVVPKELSQSPQNAPYQRDSRSAPSPSPFTQPTMFSCYVPGLCNENLRAVSLFKIHP